jgi:hypothetical protein
MNEPDYKQTWESFWKKLCTNKDGSLNLDAIQRELSDFHFVMGEVGKVYCHITGGLLSKPNYHADAVIGVYEDRVEKLIKEALEEEEHSQVNHSQV